MNLDKVKLSLVKYKVKSFVLTVGNKTRKKYTVSNELVTNISITEDYDKYYFPCFQVTISVRNKVYREMKKKNQYITVNLTLQKGKTKSAVSINNDKKITYKNALSGSFFAFMNEVTPELSETEQKAVEKAGDKYGDLSTIELLLYPYDYYKNYDIVVNTSLAGCTLADAAVYVMNYAGMKKCLMSPPSNCKVYPQFIITPLSACDQLQRICNDYAMHSAGTLVFFGLNRMYLIDRIPKCTAYEGNEYKIVYITSVNTTKASQQVGGCYANSNSHYYVANTTSIDIHNEKETYTKSVGKNTVTVGSNGDVSANGPMSKTTNVVIYDEGENNTGSMTNSVTESKRVVTATFANADLDMFTPNKQYVVTMTGVSEKKKYNGKYRLSKVIHAFSLEGNYFSLETTAEFKG